MLFDRGLVERLGLSILQGQCALWASSEAGSKPIAVDLLHKTGLAIDDLQGTFGAVRDTESAPCALLSIDSDDRSN
jgi:hypothetical protein